MTEETNAPIVINNPVADIDRANELFDQVTEKRFRKPDVFMQTVRAILELHGLLLPIESIELDTRDTYDFEYVHQFKTREDALCDVYVFLMGDMDNDMVWDCYAQIVNGSELEALLDDKIWMAEFPELTGDDITGETEYIQQQRQRGYDAD